MENRSILTAEEAAAQENYIGEIRSQNDRDAQASGRRKRAFVLTFGCQQNEADSEKLRGLAKRMGYDLTDRADDADLIAVNTCAIREHAEKRALSIVGQYKHLKEKNPNLVIAVCGCMTAQAHRCEQLKKSYPYVDIVFGTESIHRFPEFVAGRLGGGKRRFCPAEEKNAVAEGLPIERESDYRAWVSIMYGCNNFCSYCIVPYVRGRERSRTPEAVCDEVRGLVAKGYREITLLGQNVNSYGKDLGIGYDFADLLAELDRIEGDYVLRFMTSHPKDASRKLIDVMASSRHVAHQFHLPMQAGSDRILKRMNRHGDSAMIREVLAKLRREIPDIIIRTTFIVGFPGETDADFEALCKFAKEEKFDHAGAFTYSREEGTPAYDFPDQIDEQVKQDRLDLFMRQQMEINEELNREKLGKVITVLCEGYDTVASVHYGRSAADSPEIDGKVYFKSPMRVAPGTFVNVKVNDVVDYDLYGDRV